MGSVRQAGGHRPAFGRSLARLLQKAAQVCNVNSKTIKHVVHSYHTSAYLLEIPAQ